MSKSNKFQIKYGIVPNNLLYNKSMSLAAKGMFAFIQSKGEGFEFTIELIESQCKEPLEEILIILDELEKIGCIENELTINN